MKNENLGRERDPAPLLKRGPVYPRTLPGARLGQDKAHRRRGLEATQSINVRNERS